MNANFPGLLAPTALLVTCLSVAQPVVRADIPVTLTRVGDPIWLPVDFHLFSAPADTDDAFFAVANEIAPSPEPPIAPPYDKLLAERIAAAGFQDASIFLPTNIDGQPSGMYHAFLMVPDPGTVGSSFDFASGPIIPNRLFPLAVHAALLRNGVVVDPDVFDGEIPPAPGFDGQSRGTVVLEDDANFFPAGTELPGNWQYRTTLRDAEGNGWDVSAPFQIVPEPRGAAVTLIMLLCVAALSSRRSMLPDRP